MHLSVNFHFIGLEGFFKFCGVVVGLSFAPCSFNFNAKFRTKIFCITFKIWEVL